MQGQVPVLGIAASQLGGPAQISSPSWDCGDTSIKQSAERQLAQCLTHRLALSLSVAAGLRPPNYVHILRPGTCDYGTLTWQRGLGRCD